MTVPTKGLEVWATGKGHHPLCACLECLVGVRRGDRGENAMGVEADGDVGKLVTANQRKRRRANVIA